MKRQVKFYAIFIGIFFFSTVCNGNTNIAEDRLPLADPFILYYGNMYYAYGTSSPDGIVVYTSPDMKVWEKAACLALNKNDSYGNRQFWAPEVYYVNGQFYMYYSAEEHICVATSLSPLGPFVQDEQKPMLPDKGIDNSLFIDDNGKPYLFFVRFTDGNEIWVAELENDLKTIRHNTLHPCIHVSQDWENRRGRVTEGPFVIKHNGVYYLTYSANDYQSQDYGIGVATSTDIMGEWKKSDKNPILQKPEGLVGSGHHCFFKDKDGKWQVAFHAHKSSTAIHPREMYITSADFRQLPTGETILWIDPEYKTPLLRLPAIKNPVLPGVPDAGVMKYNGRYYIGGVATNGDFYVSTDLVHWGNPIHAVTMDNEWATPFGVGNEQIHANDLHYINGTFHLYWSVNHWSRERNVVHIVHAEADKPLGPYHEPVKDRWLDNRIDPHLFIDDDGKMYLYMVKFTDGNTIWARPMKDPSTFEGEPKYIFASQPGNWETLDNRVEEGPWVIKYRNRYYLMYNTNHTSTEWGNYMLGVAEASGPLEFNHGNKYAHPVVKPNQIELEEKFVNLLKYQDSGMFYYSFSETGDEWYRNASIPEAWNKGKPGFGFPITENSATYNVKTEWKTQRCCLYKPFVYDKNKNGNLSLRIHHRGATKAWLNGTLIYSSEKPDYLHVDLRRHRRLLQNGENILAIEGQGGRRSNFLDAALFDMKNETADDILFTPGQPNILRGPNGFEWWLIYMANKNNERRGQYINRVHFFGNKLTVDGITAQNTDGYHPEPAKPDYQFLVDNNQSLPPVNQTIPGNSASHYYFEAAVKPVSGTSADGIIAWKADESNWLNILLDGKNRKWYYTMNIKGKKKTASFALPDDFRPDVFHSISVFKNHTDFTVNIDNLPAPGQAVISTPFAGKGLPGIYSAKSNAEWDGITYNVGWDEYGKNISGWTASQVSSGLQLKGDLLDCYEFSLQANATSGKGSAGIYPVYIDADNYLKVNFDFSNRQCIVSGKNKGKNMPAQTVSLSKIQDYYASMVYSDYMERHFIFDAPTALDALLFSKEAVAGSDTLIENIHDNFNLYYVKDGKWQELTNVKQTEWYHPGFSRIEFPAIETGELIFTRKTAEQENFRMQNLMLQKIGVGEVFKHSYNLRAVKSRDSIHLFVDGKQVLALPNSFGDSQVGMEMNSVEVDAITLFHLGSH
jgi:beta-xylosidase